jgi:4-amino-4-deoxy-L-arabinose transferase-like glycosyltransferase
VLRERSEAVIGSVRKAWTEPEARWLLLAGLAAFTLYQVSQEPGTQVYNQYVRLADSFLHGRVDIMDPAPWLEGAFFEGRFYSHQGVLPAVLLVPFVALFGPDFELRHFAALLGAGVSMAVWTLATRIGLEGWTRVAGWALPVMGTTIWFEAKAGSTWGVAALASVLFLFLALAEYFGKQRLWLVGLFVGLAAASRPSAILALIGFALVVRNPRRIVQLGLGAAGPVLLILSYNFLRFGTLFDRSQELHYIQDSFRHQRPPGQFSVAHIPFNLYSWFFMTPDFQSEFPYLRLTIMGTALPLTSPALLTSLGAKRERWLWLCAVCVVGPAALHYANGFAQFGMRYLLDAVPFLTALVFLALRDGRGPGYRALLGASVAINAYGVAYTTVYGLQL